MAVFATRMPMFRGSVPVDDPAYWDPVYWRTKAGEIYVLAESMKVPDARILMLELASAYCRFAEWVEEYRREH